MHFDTTRLTLLASLILLGSLLQGCASTPQKPWTELKRDYTITEWMNIHNPDVRPPLNESRYFGKLSPEQWRLLKSSAHNEKPFGSVEIPIPAPAPLKAVYETRRAPDWPLPNFGYRDAYKVGAIPYDDYWVQYLLLFEDGTVWLSNNTKLYDLETGTDLTECRYFYVQSPPCDTADTHFVPATSEEIEFLKKYRGAPVHGSSVSRVVPFDDQARALVFKMRIRALNLTKDGWIQHYDLRYLFNVLWDVAEGVRKLGFVPLYPKRPRQIDESFHPRAKTVFIADKDKRLLLMTRGIDKYTQLERIK